MKKIIVNICFICLHYSAFTQSDARIGVLLSPNLSWNDNVFIKTGYNNPPTEKLSVKPKINLSFGIVAETKIKKNIFAQAGIIFFNSTYSSYFQPFNIDNPNYDYSPFDLKYTLSSLDAPIILKYKTKFPLQFLLGYSINYLIQEREIRQHMIFSSSKEKHSYSLSEITSGYFNFGINMEHKISKNYFFSYGFLFKAMIVPKKFSSQSTLNNQGRFFSLCLNIIFSHNINK